MSANIKCYDPATGGVLFDLSSHTSRLIAVFGSDINEGTMTLSEEELGGGEVFWYTTDPAGGSGHITVININSPTFEPYRDLTVNINRNEIYFKKHKDITLYVGVRV